VSIPGKRIIDPVDDIRGRNPPSNEPLLDALTKDFKDHDFDVRHLIRHHRQFANYQASIATVNWNESDKTNFSHQSPRRLNAEQYDGRADAGHRGFSELPEVPADTSAERISDPHVGKTAFSDLFGRPVARGPPSRARERRI